MNKKFYLIYKITNNLNQKFYIGKHETNNLDDDYFGSGKALSNAKEKYGLENFTKTILFYCANREEMNLLERCVVTPEFCKRSDVYNINEGGDGGWHHVNNDLHMNGNKMFVKNMTPDDFKKRAQKILYTKRKHISQLSLDEQQKLKAKHRQHAIDVGFINSFKGKHHTESAKQKIGKATSISQSGKGNSQYGKRWIYNDQLRISMPVFEEWFYEYISQGWKKGHRYYN